jgi:hypothetical protein
VTPGDNSLMYDPATGEYNYPWKTDKTWTGSCRQLTVVLADGSIHQANFQMEK